MESRSHSIQNAPTFEVAPELLLESGEIFREALPQKLAAFEVLHGKREQWGYPRFWKGDYLSMQDELEPGVSNLAYRDGINNLKLTHPFGKVIFSTYLQVTKKWEYI